MRLFVLPIFDGVIMDGHPSKMGKTNNLIFYSLIKRSRLPLFSSLKLLFLHTVNLLDIKLYQKQKYISDTARANCSISVNNLITT